LCKDHPLAEFGNIVFNIRHSDIEIETPFVIMVVLPFSLSEPEPHLVTRPRVQVAQARPTGPQGSAEGAEP
jgi:hypothetical protein